jgi:hypothetical protein
VLGGEPAHVLGSEVRQADASDAVRGTQHTPRQLRPRDLVLDREAFAFGALDTIEDTPNYLLAKFRKDEGALL